MRKQYEALLARSFAISLLSLLLSSTIFLFYKGFNDETRNFIFVTSTCSLLGMIVNLCHTYMELRFENDASDPVLLDDKTPIPV